MSSSTCRASFHQTSFEAVQDFPGWIRRFSCKGAGLHVERAICRTSAQTVLSSWCGPSERGFHSKFFGVAVLYVPKSSAGPERGIGSSLVATRHVYRRPAVPIYSARRGGLQSPSTRSKVYNAELWALWGNGSKVVRYLFRMRDIVLLFC